MPYGASPLGHTVCRMSPLLKSVARRQVTATDRWSVSDILGHPKIGPLVGPWLQRLEQEQQQRQKEQLDGQRLQAARAVSDSVVSDANSSALFHDPSTTVSYLVWCYALPEILSHSTRESM
jgi:hypothetical protein